MRLKSPLYIGLLCLVFALAANQARACGQASDACCSDPAPVEAGTAAASNCCETAGDCTAQHPGKKCSDTGHCGGHCPCSATAASPSSGLTNYVEWAGSMPACSDSFLAQNFYFARFMPEDVYSSIWHPPQLS